MKLMRTVASIPAIAFLVGCSVNPATQKPEPVNSRIDLEKVHQVERDARRAGLDVIWVHLPTKGKQR